MNPRGAGISEFGNLSFYEIWNIRESNFCWAPYLKCFGTLQFEFFRTIFTSELPIFYPLIGASLCNHSSYNSLKNTFLFLYFKFFYRYKLFEAPRGWYLWNWVTLVIKFWIQVFFAYLLALLKSWVTSQLWFVVVLKCYF